MTAVLANLQLFSHRVLGLLSRVVSRTGYCVVALLALTGCYGASFSPLGKQGANRPARSPDDVKVLPVSVRPPDYYESVGLIGASGAGFEAALKRAKDMAGMHGCDAIFIERERITSGRRVVDSDEGAARNDLRVECLIEHEHAE